MKTATALTEADIALLVDRFYEKVRRAPDLGAVFNPAVHDWDEHKATLVSFWSSVALRAGSYRGNPMAMHRSHPISAAHFDRWLRCGARRLSRCSERRMPPSSAVTPIPSRAA